MTLVELLIATAIAGIVLSAAYGWVWSVASFASTHDDRAQAATIAGAAARAIAGDVRASVAVLQPPAGRDPSRSVALLHDHVDVAPEQVLFVWDPARRVLWRNASGTYVADHVSDLRLDFVLGDGRLVEPAAMTLEDWSHVTAVRVRVVSSVGSASVERALCVGLGST